MFKESEVDVWLCCFASEAAVEAYFDESYEDDDHPISKFAADMGESYYDHDYMELGDFRDPPISDIKVALSHHSYSSSYLAEVVAAFSANPFNPFNSMLLMWNHEIERPVSIARPEYTLHYLGRFKSDSAAGSAG